MTGAGDLKRRRDDYVRRLSASYDRIIDQLASLPEVERVILFGSYAAGRRDLFTDLDLLVIMSSEEDFVSRAARLHALLEAEVDLDLLVYTPEEFERLKDHGFVRQVVESGKVAYEKKLAGRR